MPSTELPWCKGLFHPPGVFLNGFFTVFKPLNRLESSSLPHDQLPHVVMFFANPREGWTWGWRKREGGCRVSLKTEWVTDSKQRNMFFFLGLRNMKENHLEFLTIILVVVVWFLILGRSSGVWLAWPRKEFIKSCHMLNGNQYTPEQWKKQWLFRVYIGDYIFQLCRGL